MTEAAGSARAEMERRIVQRSIEDDSFRQRLIEDPKGAVEQELGTQLPEEVRVSDRGGECGHHLPGASKHLDGRRCGRRTFRSRARVGGWRLGPVPKGLQQY